VPATYFQHPFASEIDLGRVAMLKLNEVPVGLVGRLQREGHRRIFLAAQLGNTDRWADRPPRASRSTGPSILTKRPSCHSVSK
jgi:hypothetical protein